MSVVSLGECRLSINGKEIEGVTEAELTVNKIHKPRSTLCWLCGRRLYQWRVHIEREVDGHSRILHRACSEALKKNPDARGPLDVDFP